MRLILTFLFTLTFIVNGLQPVLSQAEHSVARQWNEVVLKAIRHDFAQPTIHARNLFHISAAMYDAWAAYEPEHETYFLGKTHGDFTFPYEPCPVNIDNIDNIETARHEAISYVTYRLLEHRYRNAPGLVAIKASADSLMQVFGYDINNFSSTACPDQPAAFGNYLAEQIISYGLQDGANEVSNYQNQFYQPANEPLNLSASGIGELTDPNRWQPLQFEENFVDQSGNPVGSGAIDFLSPEWGNVVPFALSEQDRTTRERDGQTYTLYHDPGPPPYLDTANHLAIEDPYKWGFTMVSVWQGMLNADDERLIDISPASIGNLQLSDMPEQWSDFDSVYDFFGGGDASPGYTLNPVTGQPYLPQMAKVGDYGRVLAEFWADGPDSETPPGHWYVILNYVNDHPDLERKYQGQGETLSALEWDVKAYFSLGGAMHDAAIAAWSVKGYYDYIRPISAIRFMAAQGQSTSPELPRYSPQGIPLIDDWVALVGEYDPLVGDNLENLNKIKLFSWRGHDFVDSVASNYAGTGWILAENWWPYQRPSFVTPPFAGYVSGHSTFSRAAAEVLTLLTGSEYFPGGMAEFYAPQNEFLVFENGPSQDITLQWAKYYDASDQCSISRIWGGIHPPADDLPGRQMGARVGQEAFAKADRYFNVRTLSAQEREEEKTLPKAYPNPTTGQLFVAQDKTGEPPVLTDLCGKQIDCPRQRQNAYWLLHLDKLAPGVYLLSNRLGQTQKIIKR